MACDNVARSLHVKQLRPRASTIVDVIQPPVPSLMLALEVDERVADDWFLVITTTRRI